MFGNYAELCNEITDELHRSDLRAKVPGFLEQVEDELTTDIAEYRGTVFQTTGNLVPAVDTITLPAGCLEPLHIRLDTNPIRMLEIVAFEMLTSVRSNAALNGEEYPVAGALFNQNTIKLSNAPTTTDGYTLFYRARMPDIDQDSTTSQVLEEAPRLLLAGSCYFAAMYTRNAEDVMGYSREFERQKGIYRRHLWRASRKFGHGRVKPATMINDGHTRRS